MKELLPHNRLTILWRTVAIALAAVNAIAGMVAQAMGEDGINYLDQGDAWLRGDWDTAVNGTWSPMYALLLGTAVRLLRPTIHQEFPLVHAMNFIIFLIALLCFEFFWREVTRQYEATVPDEGPRDRLPSWAFLSIGYAYFVWVTICLIRVFVVTPDMLVAASVFLVGGLLVRVAASRTGTATAAALGAALGAGYLAKAVMFPIAVFTLVVAGIAMWRSGKALRRLAPALIAFVLVAGPFMTALSLEVGRFTFSEVGRVSYIKHVLQAPYPHLQAGSADITGTPLHPIQASATSPPVYRFDSRIPTTYPLSYDQGYWFAGVSSRFNAARQVEAIVLNLQRYFELFIRVQGPVLAILLLLLLMRGRGRIPPGSLVLGLLGLAAMAIYSLVYVEGRYVGPFIMVLCAAILLAVSLPAANHQPRWLSAASIVLIAGLAVNIGTFHLDGLNALVGIAPVVRQGPVSRTGRPPDKATDVAAGVQAKGLVAGDRIGVIGEAIHATWARLARLRIVADVAPDGVNTFWQGSTAQQEAILSEFRDAGVRAVIADAPRDHVVPPGWERVGRTHTVIRFIASAKRPEPPEPNR